MTTKTILLLADEKALRTELKNRDKNVPKILFCFGNSFISHLIQAKTQVRAREVIQTVRTTKPTAINVNKSVLIIIPLYL